MFASLSDDLHRNLDCEVRDDIISKAVYSVDASIYEIEPEAIVVPKNFEDVRIAVSIARKHSTAVIPRGAATGIAGGCIGRGLIIDTAQYLCNIKEINYDAEYAICEPGVVQSQLNQALAGRDYRLGPDTSTGNRATLGGMLGNDAAGSRSLRYGKMRDHISSVDLLLYSGELLTFTEIDAGTLQKKLQQHNREGEIYREIMHLREHYSDDIHKHLPNIPRRASGYNLDLLLGDEPLNLAKIIAGSEGTLGIVTQMTVKICKRPQKSRLCLIPCTSLNDAFSLVVAILKWKPLALELIDSKILEAGRSLPSTRERMGWLEGSPQAVLVVEFDSEQQHVQNFVQHMHPRNVRVLEDATDMANVWAVREGGLGLLLSKRSYNRAIAFLEDVAVSPEHLASFMDAFTALLARYGKEAGIYGHAGAGCMHVRPYVDLRQPEELISMRAIMEETAELLLQHEGTLSGEHGDGIVRAWLNEKMFGKRVYEAFIRLKKAFDPAGKMNPGKIISAQDLTENLRMSPDVKQATIATQFDFSRQGGFNLAVDLCNGNGLCRKREGLMCPSFQAYGDEFHTTRARAQSLREIVNGKLSLETFTSKELYHVLEYCLECKGCKTECPSQIDMAKMKAEFLYHYQEKNGYSLRSRLFAHVATINKWTAPLAKIYNAVGKSTLIKKLFSAIGIAPERSLPPLALQRFSKQYQTKPSQGNPQVVLFLDTYTEFHYPEIGHSAVKVLRAFGYDVIVPFWQCCGRPLISKGMLKQAKKAALQLIEHLRPYVEKNIPIVGLEPSCILTIRDDYPDLVPSEFAEKLAALCQPIDILLASHDTFPWLQTKPQSIHFHTHCHQKALVGSSTLHKVLSSIPHSTVTEITSGCCGLAGSFGYEKEHYAMSMTIGENKLFPAIRNADANTVVIANGMSCRSQIAQGTGHHALHLVELLARALD